MSAHLQPTTYCSSVMILFVKPDRRQKIFRLYLYKLKPETHFAFAIPSTRMKVLSSSFLLLLRSSSAFSNAYNPNFLASTRAYSSTSLMSKPFSVLVEAEIQPDRMDEFMKMIENNAENSRKEAGCIRFGR